jgi:putative peptide zinc metalloprotease protein
MPQKREIPSGNQNLWTDLETKTSVADKPAQDIWTDLEEKLDFSKSRPKRVNTVEVSRQTFRGVEFYILENIEKKTYLRIDKKGFFLWGLMDGKHSLTDMTLAYLLEYGAPPFDQLLSLLSSLKSSFLLEDEAPDLYGLISNRAAQRMTKSRLIFVSLNSILKNISQAELSLDVDGYCGWLYNHGGYLLYTSPMKIFFVAISILGSILFMRLFTDGIYDLEGIGKSTIVGPAFLLVINLILAVFHEHGHALTTKSFRRKVNKGGFLIYFGMPCFFVDTTDMWFGTKNQRIEVSFAGPFTTIIIGSICAIAATIFPASKYEPLLFGIAAIGMLSALANFNPLLEWDGYYMLMNYLEIPGLRSKSFEFIRMQLLRKVLSRQLDFSKEERIFAVFGVAAGIWSVIAILLIPYFWSEVIFPIFGPIWSGPWDGIKVAISILAILVILVAASSVAFGIWRRVKHI